MIDPTQGYAVEQHEEYVVVTPQSTTVDYGFITEHPLEGLTLPEGRSVVLNLEHAEKMHFLYMGAIGRLHRQLKDEDSSLSLVVKEPGIRVLLDQAQIPSFIRVEDSLDNLSCMN